MPKNIGVDPSMPTIGGSRVRLGVVIPSVNTVVEPLFNAICPPGVAVHASRMWIDESLTHDAIIAMDRTEGFAAVKSVASCRPHAVGYCCTISSVVQGIDYDLELQREIAALTGVPAVTAAQSVVHAAKVLDVRRIAIASPYSEEFDSLEKTFFESAGLEVVGTAFLGIEAAFDLASPTSDDIYALAKRAYRSDAQAIVIPCLNLWSQTVVQRLEADLGVPVLTSTQSMIWRLLRISGVEDRFQGLGRLMAEH